ncbi:HAD family hydrolase [Streptomyces sp. L7]
MPRPGALDLLRRPRPRRRPHGTRHRVPRAVADTVLDALGASRFAVSVTADDTGATKPAPDPYLAACRALGVDPAACVAVEDTADRRQLRRGGRLRGPRRTVAGPDRHGPRPDGTGEPRRHHPGGPARDGGVRHRT